MRLFKGVIAVCCAKQKKLYRDEKPWKTIPINLLTSPLWQYGNREAGF